MPRRTTVAPPFTRVHKLFRIRTVVNAVSELSEQKKNATDRQIAEVLASKKLSKLKHERIRHRIHRRARDHLLNAAYLGLVTRSEKRPFNYESTPVGRLLRNYRFVDECPKDALEKAVFTDRLMRSKLTNVYDMQFKKTYHDYLTRPFLYILTLLRYQPLHIFQIYEALGERNSDPNLNPKGVKKVLEDFSEYPNYDKKAIDRFCDVYDFDKAKRREARRSAKPMMDWCEQLGLGFRDGDWYFISELGLTVQERYLRRIPVWFYSLGDGAEFKAALILAYLAAREEAVRITKSFLKSEVKGMLTGENVENLLIDAQEELGIQIFNSRFSRIGMIDFDFFYDIPISLRSIVLALFQNCVKEIGLPSFNVSQLELSSVENIEHIIKETTQEKSISKIGELLGFDIPRPELFKVPFEWTTCFLLRSIGYRADKYQGQFVEYTGMRMAEANPDIIIEDAFTSLVECKSSAEWGAQIKLDKRIVGEILFYEDYTETLNANSTLFVCEGRFAQKEFVVPVTSLLKKKVPKVLMSTQQHLARALRNEKLKIKLNDKIKNPEEFEPKERILI